MSFEEDIITKYAPTFGGRLYWDTSPEGWKPADMEVPFGILGDRGGKRQTYVDDKEQPEFLNSRIQLFIWGKSRVAVNDKMREFVGVVMASNLPEFYASAEGEAMGDWNEVLKLRGSRQDFMFWYKNPLYVE